MVDFFEKQNDGDLLLEMLSVGNNKKEVSQ